MASASVYVMNLDLASYQKQTTPMLSHLNVGTGADCSIKELTETVAEIIGFQGNIVWDDSKPDGAPRKLMDSARISGLGWRPKFGLKDGLENTYRWYLNNLTRVRF